MPAGRFVIRVVVVPSAGSGECADIAAAPSSDVAVVDPAPPGSAATVTASVAAAALASVAADAAPAALISVVVPSLSSPVLQFATNRN